MQKYLYFKMILYYFKIRQSFYLICIRYKILCMWVYIWETEREVSHLLHQTYVLALWPNTSNFVSADHKSFSRKHVAYGQQISVDHESINFGVGTFFLVWYPLNPWGLLLFLQFPAHDRLEPWWFLTVSSHLRVTVRVFFQTLPKWWHIRITRTCVQLFELILESAVAWKCLQENFSSCVNLPVSLVLILCSSYLLTEWVFLNKSFLCWQKIYIYISWNYSIMITKIT